MIYNKKQFFIPPWVSCHTYFYGTERSRTYISNEKNHAYVLLEGYASDMWKLLADDNDEFVNWAKNNGLENEIEGFLTELAGQELLEFGSNDNTDNCTYNPIAEKDEEHEETKFIEEMSLWLFENGFMSSLFFELTYRCNLKCVHCYNPKDSFETELDFDLCKKTIDDAYDAGCFKMTFSGGESTLHSRFYDIIAYARKKRISVEIFTNGQILAQNETLYRKVLSLYPYRICVSLYSTKMETHEKVTAINGSFDKTYGLIQRLRKDNVNVQIKNFLLNFNCMDCISVKQMAQEIGATSVADISLIPTIQGDKKTFCYALDEQSLFKLYTDEKSPLYVGNIKPKIYGQIKDVSPCFGGFSGLCVNPDGNVIICVSLPISVGNLSKESIKEIWLNAVNNNPDSELYKWQKITNKDLSECYKHDYCAFCHYCPGMGYLENGYLKKSDVLCLQAKTKMKAYNYLKTQK